MKIDQNEEIDLTLENRLKGRKEDQVKKEKKIRWKL